MRREGRLSGNIWKAYLGEMVKVQGKPTNASKFSGKCGRARCDACHSLPVSKSKAKTKGRNKRSLPFNDEWVVRPPLSGCNQITNTALLDTDYDDNNSPDMWHADRCGAKDVYDYTHDVAEAPPFFNEAVALLANLASCVPNVHHADVCHADGHADRRDVKDINDYNDCAAQARPCSNDGVNAAAACALIPLKEVEEMFVGSAGHDDDASIWDHKMFADMVDDVILDKDDDGFKDDCADIPIETSCGCLTDEIVSDIESEKSSTGDKDDDGFKDQDCADVPIETSCGCLTDEIVSDTESEKSSDDWCHVTPSEIIDDWYMC